MDGLVWKTESRKEPIAYGVYKLIVGCVIEDDKVGTDDLVDAIQAFEDDVQSVDILSFNKIWEAADVYSINYIFEENLPIYLLQAP